MASEKDLKVHLSECSENFIPPLIERVDLGSYAKKISTHAITFEAWNDKELIGLIAVYCSSDNKVGFITNVSVLKRYMGAGIATLLLKESIDALRKRGCEQLNLEVNEKNEPAIAFYKSNNFIEIEKNGSSLVMRYLINK